MHINIANLITSLSVMWKGMLGIFIVMIILMILVRLLHKIK